MTANQYRAALAKLDIQHEQPLGRIAEKLDRLEDVHIVLLLLDLLAHVPLREGLGAVVLLIDRQGHYFVDALCHALLVL